MENANGHKVSVIVVNFDGLAHVERCLDSVFSQQYTPFEVIFVDNGSTDGSLQRARERYPDAIYVENDSNYGYPVAVNVGLARASGHYIVPLNIDTEVNAAWLSSQVALLDKDKSIAATAPVVVRFDARDRVNTAGLDLHASGLGFCRGLDDPVDQLPDTPFRVPGPSGCSFMIRKEVFHRLRGLNGDTFMYYDDVDLGWMLALAGEDVCCVPQAVVYHKYDLRMNASKFFYLERNRWRLVCAAFGKSGWLLFAPILLATEAMVLAYSVIKGPRYARAKLAAMVAALRNPAALRERRAEIQRLRKRSDVELFRLFRLSYPWRQLLAVSRGRSEGKRSELV